MNNNNKKAINEFQKGIKITPKNADLRQDLAYTLFEIKDYKKACKHFKIALKYRKKDAYIKLGYSIVLYKSGKEKLALKLFNEAIEKNFNWYSFPVILKKNYSWNSSMLNDWHEIKLASEKK